MILNRLVLMLVFFLITLPGPLFAQAKTSTPLVTDGPYISTESENELAFSWLCESSVKSMKVTYKQLPFNFSQCQLKVAIDRSSFLEQSILEYQGDFKVAAASDFHGQYDLMRTLLTNNHIIDAKGDWAFGNGHFVITGDVFDRGDKVTEILWFLYQLEKQAELAGGKLHLLLGNHEVMVLNGDLRYLHPKYVETARLLAQPFEELLGKDTVLGAWLRSKSVLVKVNNMLFAHGGFHPSLAQQKKSLIEINKTFKNNLVASELLAPRAGWGKYLHKSNGPIWYRGYFKKVGKDQGASSAEIDLLLSHFEIDHLVVGHTSQKQVETRYKGRVIAIDTSIKKGQYGEILLIEGKDKWRGTLSGEKVKLD